MFKMLVTLCLIQFALAADPIVKINDGSLRGSILKDMDGKDFIGFQGVPFAKPPVGKLRFKDPEPVEKWTGVINATQEPPMCLQKSFLLNNIMIGVEDCLFLNVYTPELKPKKLKPVIVFIHGGGFVELTGGFSSYGPGILMSMDVVFVTMNYRLGVLGFTSFSNPALNVPGNAGMKDQVAALKWIKKNICHFGGDPNQVTISGESAGAASVHLHALSPLSKGLFQRAVIQSGSALAPWCNGEVNNGIGSAKALGYEGDDEMEMLNLLQNATTEQLKIASEKAFILTRIDIPNTFGPVVERKSKKAFLSDTPRNIIKSGNFNRKVQLMLGITNAEGMIFDIFFILKYGIYTPFKPSYFIPYYFDSTKKSEIEQRLLNFYNPQGISNQDGNVSLSTDSYFTYPLYETVYGHLLHNQDMFLYLYSSESEMNFMKNSNNITKEYKGVSHMDDLWYIFTHSGTPDVAYTPGSTENKAIKNSARLFVNFARYGTPTLQGDTVQWEKVTKGPIKYLDIDLDKNHLRENFFKNRTDFWCDLYKEYGQEHFC